MCSEPAGVEVIGKTCPYCQSSIKPRVEVTICEACGIPHHTECWQANGGCTTFGCSGSTGGASGQSRGAQPMSGQPSAGYIPPPPGQVYPANAYQQITAEVKGWNWGAFCLPLLWTGAMNLWGWFAAILVTILVTIWIPYVNWICGLAFSIYLGVKGNELAWESRAWQSLEHFRATQRVWRNWGIALLIFGVILLIGNIRNYLRYY